MTLSITKPSFAVILNEAHAAAFNAAKDLPDVGACGFAWVTVAGNEPIARFCRQQDTSGPWATGRGYYGSKGYPKGWQWWSPGYNGQSIDAKEKAAQAFRDALGTYGIVATVGSRLD